MLRFVEVAVGKIRQPFQAHRCKQVISVGNFPCVDQRNKRLLVVPKVERVLGPLGFMTCGCEATEMPPWA